MSIRNAINVMLAPFLDNSPMMIAQMRAESFNHEDGFSPRYRVSTSDVDPFETPSGIIGGENYGLVTRWAEISFARNPNIPLYIWDTQSRIPYDRRTRKGGGMWLTRRITYLLKPDGFLSRTAIAIDGS